MKSRITFLFYLFVLLFVKDAFAYKTDTHIEISNKAVTLSEKYKRFLQEFSQDSNIAFGLTGFGSFAEDNDPRYLRHFYDPVSEVGLSRIVGHFEAASSWGYQSSDNLYSWTKAREYMYKALTGATREVQDENYRNLYRALGQIIHLVEDMAQPSHVRNDPHVSHSESVIGALYFNPSHLEDWAQSHGSGIISYANSATGPRSVDFFDDAFETLALFSNQNFFSDDTIFKSYELPSKDETNYTEDFLPYGIGQVAQVLAEDGQIYYVPYIVKTSGIYSGYKLAQVGYFGLAIFGTPYRNLAFQIDDEVAKENAQLLIPQAVAYSTGLLDYFFRGSIDAQADGAGIKITNNSFETMTGTFALYYDATDGTRKQAIGASWSNVSLAPGTTSDRLIFTPPTDAKEPGQYILIFQGTMGAESGDVVGKVIAACQGLCEDWEGASAHYYTNQLRYPHFSESGSPIFQTKNGEASIACNGFNYEGVVDIKQGIGSNNTNALSVYIHANPLFYSNNSQCGVALTLREPLLLSKYHRLSVDYFVSSPELLSFAPSAALGPQINFFVIYFDQPIVPPYGEYILTYTPEYTYSLDLSGAASWKTFKADIFDRLGLTDAQLSGVKIVKIRMDGRFNFQNTFPYRGLSAARTFAWDNIQIFGDQ